MKVLAVSRQNVELRLAENELVMLNNALNEVCHALDLDEFEARMGASKEQARELLNAIGRLLDQMFAT
jgi:hypothetical protein